jgi:hypothetical protein
MVVAGVLVGAGAFEAGVFEAEAEPIPAADCAAGVAAGLDAAGSCANAIGIVAASRAAKVRTAERVLEGVFIGFACSRRLREWNPTD